MRSKEHGTEGFQMRLEIPDRINAVIILKSGGEIIPKPESPAREHLLETVVEQTPLDIVIQDLIDTRGEDPDKSGYFSKLRKAMESARQDGKSDKDFILQVERTLSQVRRDFEGSRLGDYPKVVSTIHTLLKSESEDVWTEDLTKKKEATL